MKYHRLTIYMRYSVGNDFLIAVCGNAYPSAKSTYRKSVLQKWSNYASMTGNA